MPTPDLPVELWQEILSYLPRSTLRKMIGVNRLLFELALDELYEEVRFIADDKNMLNTFDQLRHTSIARRVRHLYIRPAFLPGMEDTTSGEPRLRRKVSSVFSSLRRLKRNSTTDVAAPKEALRRHSPHILETAKKGVQLCPNIHEITIVIHDLAITPSFSLFLDSLWSSDSIGPNVRKMSIDTTVTKLPVLLKAFPLRPSSLWKLEELNINISVSRIKQTLTDWPLASQAFVSFLEALAPTLTALTFSCLVMCDLATMFDSLPRIQHLEKFEFLSKFNTINMPHAQGFTKFIAQHAPTLETLVVKPNARQSTLDSSDDSYSVWLNHGDDHKSEAPHSFSHVALPKLRNLEVGVRDTELYYMWGWDPHPRNAQILPNLSRVTPNLTRLVITDVKLIHHRISGVVEALGQREGGCLLEELTFSCGFISPPLFDVLAKNLPHLKRLTIGFSWTAPTVEHDGLHSALQYNTLFHEIMRARRYPCWPLEYLRMDSPSPCGIPHPAISVMRTVAESLSSKVMLDTECPCKCPGSWCVPIDHT